LYYKQITAKLLSYGLEPALGYLHTPFREHNALASDILEVFRAEINEKVYEVFSCDYLKKEDFTSKHGVYLKYSGRIKIWKHYLQLISSLKPKLDFEISNLKMKIEQSQKIHFN